MRIAVLVALLIASTSCARRALNVEAGPAGNFTAVLNRAMSRARPARAPVVVVLFSEADAIGIDPVSGQRLWRRPIRVHGQPSVNGRSVVIPVRGNRLVSLDADNGQTLWFTRRLPGQAFTGVAAGDRFVIATGIARRSGSRSFVAGYSSIDGKLRWVRRTKGLLGVPAATGGHAFVPLEHEVVAITQRHGREVARLTPGKRRLDRIEVHGDTLLASDGVAFADLYGGGTVRYAFESAHGSAFPAVEGLDPGLGHEDGLKWRLLDSVSAGAPREALFMARRAFFSIRLDPGGRPIEATWVHIRYEKREFVAFTVDENRITAVSEDGSLLVLDRRTGRALEEHAGEVSTIGAAFVGASPRAVADEVRLPDHGNVVAHLVGILEDPDGRMLPAQRLAVDLLWRDEAPRVRSLVQDLAIKLLRPESTPEADDLRQHAKIRMKDVWGRADEASLAKLLQQLDMPTPRVEGGMPALTRQAVKAGGPGVVDRLVVLLEDPTTKPADLVEIARALRDLDDSEAVPGVSKFVLRYHADPDIVAESPAIYYALELLIAQAVPDLPQRVVIQARERARKTLLTLLKDEFTVPALVGFINARLPSEEALKATG